MEENKANEELFGAQESVDPDQPESQEPEPEAEATPEGEPEPEAAEPQTVDYAALMREYGLTQFKDPVEVFRAVREQNRYIGQLESERTAWRRGQQPAPTHPEQKKELDPEEFLGSPDRVLMERGFVRKTEVEELVEARIRQRDEESRVAAFMAERADFKELEPDMAAIYQVNKWLDNIPASEAVAILYERAKRTRVAAVKPQTQVVPADKDKKERANTSGGKGAKPSTPKATETQMFEDAKKLSPEEFEEKYGFGV